MRITENLAKMLRRYLPLYVNTHFNHPKELTPEAAAACATLADHGIPLGNQSVLLREINDCPHVMRALMHGPPKEPRASPTTSTSATSRWASATSVRPWRAASRLWKACAATPAAWPSPTFVVDAPGGGGKIPVMPSYLLSQAPGQIIVRNYEGTLSRYLENPDTTSGCGRHAACHDPALRGQSGPWA